ncbi:diguanylate cyclase [Saccharopolyspora sp. TS4A08]|uniref:Diguanylate cyclase n=1 Tax=Saccharopolyspora ipomoeae TaxID=3042027 RepID=A0ABT6PUV6_9PSEU|nr:sensor domain-containing diguanylate cyclase [Saccharopolyspora sp. TS4A08]MDI2031788.1 diguanylate cyclase [Saccharopolyspora sp. TS4A08]
MDNREDNALDTVAWEALWKRVPSPVALVDLQGRIIEANPSLCRMLGYARERLLELSPSDVTYGRGPVLDLESAAKMAEEEQDSSSEEKRLVRADGSVIWALISSASVPTRAGGQQLIISQFQDITAQRASDLLWRQVLSNAPVGMAMNDLYARATAVNDKVCELVGYSRDELIGCGTELAYEPDKERIEALYAEFREGRVESASLDFCMRHRDGHPFWLAGRFSLIRGPDDRPTSVVCLYEALNGAARVNEEHLAELTRKALHDPLTGLANRALFLDRFQKQLGELTGRRGLLALFMIDLDGLKAINDTHGHLAGDAFLQAAAEQLLSAVRPDDTVARIGGDEFVVLATVADQDRAERMRKRIDQQLNKQATAPGRDHITLAASVGLATTNDVATTSHTLLGEADRDMYARKRARTR